MFFLYSDAIVKLNILIFKWLLIFSLYGENIENVKLNILIFKWLLIFSLYGENIENMFWTEIQCSFHQREVLVMGAFDQQNS